MLLVKSVVSFLLVGVLTLNGIVSVGGANDSPNMLVLWEINNTSLKDSYLRAFQHHPLRKGINYEWLEFLRNKSIVFIGDSLTRFQYLNLAMFLFHGQWEEDPGIPPISSKHETFVNWESYLFMSCYRFACHEICDLYRKKIVGSGNRENRYFHHFGLNLTMSFFFFSPPWPTAIAIDKPPTSSDFYDECFNKWKALDRINKPFSDKFLRQYVHIYDFIDKEIAPMQPDSIVINQGLWKMDRGLHRLHNIFTAVKAACKYPIWKTTTAYQEHINEDPKVFVEQVQGFGMHVFDAYAASYGVSYLPQAFWDPMHFEPFVYRELNLAFLEYMKQLMTAGTSGTKGEGDSSFPAVGTMMPQKT